MVCVRVCVRDGGEKGESGGGGGFLPVYSGRRLSSLKRLEMTTEAKRSSCGFFYPPPPTPTEGK